MYQTCCILCFYHLFIKIIVSKQRIHIFIQYNLLKSEIWYIQGNHLIEIVIQNQSNLVNFSSKFITFSFCYHLFIKFFAHKQRKHVLIQFNPLKTGINTKESLKCGYKTNSKLLGELFYQTCYVLYFCYLCMKINTYKQNRIKYFLS